MTTEEEFINPDEAEYDPARRRRRGRMPAGLARYWAKHGRGRKGIKYHPARHRRRRHGVRHVVYDPAHRRRRRGFRALFDPARRRFHKRRYDFGRPGGWINATSDPITIAAGGMFHNFLVHKTGLGSKTYGIPFLSQMTGLNITQVGIMAGVLAILGKKMGWFGPTIHNFLGGMFSEGLNMPIVEQVQRSNVGGGSSSNPMISGGGASFPVGPYTSPSNRSISQGNIEGIAPPNYAYAEPAMGVQSVSPDGTPTAPSYVPVFGYT